MSEDITILGGGPAGGAVALGLRRLGFAVTLVSLPRPFRAMEGISERVVEGLRNAGFQHALTVLPPPTPRMACWQGTTATANTERLVDRNQLDTAILNDLKEAGVRVIEERVNQVIALDSGFRIELQTHEALHTSFLVEARGRSAPHAQLTRKRGPETIALLQYWQGERVSTGSAAVSFEHGWAWMAAGEDGTRYLQLTFDVASQSLPAKSQLVHYCNAVLHTLPHADLFTSNAQPTGALHARTSTPILCQEAVADRWIRVGDAAMAVDPLSGNGIFQSLSSALQAPAVINTLLNKPQNRDLAKQFYQQRIDHLFHRFARIGRDFYAQETQWLAHPFWQRRRQWPDNQPLHPVTDPASLKVVSLPVVNHGMIELADVVVTNDQPLGIWHHNGQPLAPIAHAFKQRLPNEPLHVCLTRQLGMPQQQAVQWAMWANHQGWV